MPHDPLPLLGLAALCAAAAAQSPLLTMTPAVSILAPAPAVTWQLAGTAALPSILLADFSGGPRFGGDLLLGSLQPAVLFIGPPGGTAASGGFAVPRAPALIGTIVYAQVVHPDPTAPNGSFRPGNGASAVIHGAPAAIVVDFANAVAQGFTGDYRSDVLGHIRGARIQRRSHETLQPGRTVHWSSIQSPLVPSGCREQMLFRAQDLGASGAPELVTAVRWHAPRVVLPDSFLQFEMLMGHSQVVPDYSVDPFSGLAVAPASGLSPIFANNEIPGAPPVSVCRGRYDILPSLAVPHPIGLFVPYPAIQPFAYDGVSSLLIDVRAVGGGTGANGMGVQLMVQSGPLPAARAVAGSTLFQPMPLPNPSAATTANQIDCAMPILQIDFARVESHAVSPWIDSVAVSPDYSAAIVAGSYPFGTAVTLRYRGSASASGANPTAWSASQDVADGLRYLQVDIGLHGNLVTDEVPIVDTLVVPIQ